MRDLYDLGIVEVLQAQVHHITKWYKPLTWVSAAIRFFRDSYWNHSNLFVITEDGKVWCVEMNPDGMNLWPIDKWLDRTDSYLSIWLPQFSYNRVNAAVILDVDLARKPKYDFRGTLWYQLVFAIGVWISKLINAVFGANTSVKWMGYTTNKAASYRYYCSEHCSHFWHRLKRELFPKWYMTAPDMMEDQLPEFDFINAAKNIHQSALKSQLVRMGYHIND